MSRVTLRRPLPPSRNTLSDTMRFQIARPLRSAMVEGIQKGTVLTSYRHLTAATDSLQGILERNRKWSEEQKKAEPTFFSKLANIQTPQWLWIGCSDSRVPANQLMGLGPGEVFVQRNVGNLVTHKDMNAMSCLEYAVTALKVKHIIVCGHHNCGAVKGALTMPNRQQGLVNLWIQDIRDTRDRHALILKQFKGDEQVNKLAELNVLRQVFNICSSPIVQAAWEDGQHLSVHGVIYALNDGLLQELAEPITSVEDLEEYSRTKLGDLQSLSSTLLEHLNFKPEQEAALRENLERASGGFTGQ
ncbi:CAH7 [Auxenochlorella protothecoides x Auxenochlorella symbiontica]|uniref:Carbonic anhydrase n=2 Tax=Auxenochlorella protothecoides TaxID=3075 RepID=A0A1D2A7N7_AUXPR